MAYGTVRPLLRTAIAGCLLFVGQAPTTPGGGPSTPPPSVTAAEVPEYPWVARVAKVGGTVRMRVWTDGRTVKRLDMVESVPLLNPAAVANVMTWQFAPHAPATFDVQVNFALSSGSTPCLRERNPTVRLRLPSHVFIEVPAQALIYPTIPDLGRVGRLAGVVLASDPAGTPVSDADIEVWSAEGRSRWMARTDARGSFAVPRLPQGVYTVRIRAGDYETADYRIQVTADSPVTSTAFRMARDACVNVTVSGAGVPTYPTEALAQRLQGDVRLRVADAGRVVDVVSGPDVLVKAAVENVRTWRYDEFRELGVDVLFRYVLDAPECAGERRPMVSVAFPREVTVLACAGVADEAERARPSAFPAPRLKTRDATPVDARSEGGRERERPAGGMKRHIR